MRVGSITRIGKKAVDESALADASLTADKNYSSPG
jgi:hypothetical protein